MIFSIFSYQKPIDFMVFFNKQQVDF